MSSTSYVPYQAYKPKRHSRVVSNPSPAEPNGTATSPPLQPRHIPSPSLDFVRRTSVEEKSVENGAGGLTSNGMVWQGGGLPLNSVLEQPQPVLTVGAVPPKISLFEASPRTKSSIEPISPISPVSPSDRSMAITVPAHSPGSDAPEPPSPSNGLPSPVTPTAPLTPIPNGSTSPSSGTPPEAGPSTTKQTGPRKSSTFRYVPLRASTGSTPRNSSPLRPPGVQAQKLSPTAPSPLSFSPQSVQSGSSPESRSLPSSHASPEVASLTLAPTPQPARAVRLSTEVPILKSVTPNLQHHRGASVDPPYETYVPPQRTSSLPPSIPSKSTSTSPIPTSLSSARIQSPNAQITQSASGSTVNSAVSTYKAVYRPGFQPKGVYRPRTDDFIMLRTRARDVGRVERTRLERRFEKLVDLHFSGTSDSTVNAKGKEKIPQSRRASSLFELDFNDLRTKSASELWKGVLESRAAAANGGKGDIRAAEQRITPWQDDAEVSACPHCSASFHPLTNRKHHCRLCGLIICSLPVKKSQRPVPCSLLFVADPKSGRIEEVSETVDYGVRPRSQVDSLGGGSKLKGEGPDEKSMKGVRICRECKPVMLRQQYRQEAKRTPAMIRLYEALISLESEIEEALPQFQELMLSLSHNTDEAPTKEASAARKQLLQCFSDYDAIAKHIHRISCPGGPGSSQERVQAAILARANMFLQKNMFPLQSLPKPKKRSPAGSSTAGSGVNTPVEEAGTQVIDPDSELARALQPLLEQEALLESFIEEARAHRKFEDVQTLRTNLSEIRAEIDRVVVRAESIGGRNQ
ncbi:hypothetical protein M0805_008892 [Coniferiporia weirii]|nr:hypothetical protein M0805_008892 [Coniferiporia weirii]